MEILSTSLGMMIRGMPPTLKMIWGVFALLAMAAVLIAVRHERRRFVARNKAGAWLFVRLASVPIALAGAATVLIPAHAIGGPEALAYFYVLAITAGPLVYFGLHALAGRLVGLARKDALSIALSGIVMILAPVLLSNLLQPWAFVLARAVDGNAASFGSGFSPGPERPPVHQVLDQRRFVLPEIGEVWTERWQAPAGVHIERVELEVNGQYVAVDGASSNYLCKVGEEVHVFWHGAVAAAHWRVHWRGLDQQLVHSKWTMTPPATAAIDFAPEWLADGLVLPVNVPSSMLTYRWLRQDGREDSGSALDDRNGSGETAPCVIALRRPVTAEQVQIVGMSIRLWRFDTQQMLYSTYLRPAGDPF